MEGEARDEGVRIYGNNLRKHLMWPNIAQKRFGRAQKKLPIPTYWLLLFKKNSLILIIEKISRC